MKLHKDILSKADMNGEIRMTDCEPANLRVVVERLINMLYENEQKMDYVFPQYNTMTELDKIMMLQYWLKYDDLAVAYSLPMGENVLSINDFQIWFIKHATEPELIRRARQLLLARHWIKVNEDVKERADNASNNFKKVKHK